MTRIVDPQLRDITDRCRAVCERLSEELHKSCVDGDFSNESPYLLAELLSIEKVIGWLRARIPRHRFDHREAVRRHFDQRVNQFFIELRELEEFVTGTGTGLDLVDETAVYKLWEAFDYCGKNSARLYDGAETVREFRENPIA